MKRSIAILCVAFALNGCGPSQDEIDAFRQTRQMEMAAREAQTLKANQDRMAEEERVRNEPARLQQETADRAQSHASAALIAFEANLLPIHKAAALSGVAGRCGIRSGRWAATMAAGLHNSDAKDPAYFKLSHDEQTAAFMYGSGIFRKYFIETKCSELFRDPIMNKLDELESELSGNYH